MIARLLRFVALPPDERGRTVEAAVFLLVVRVAFAMLSMRRALRLFGMVTGETGSERTAPIEAAAVGRAIARAARHVPFRAMCLQQAFAAVLMLRRRGLGATVHLGLARKDGTGDLQAHAWSRCGDVPVTGAAAANGFASVATFAA